MSAIFSSTMSCAIFWSCSYWSSVIVFILSMICSSVRSSSNSFYLWYDCFMIFQYSPSRSSVISRASMLALLLESFSWSLSLGGFWLINLFKFRPVWWPNFKPILFMILPSGEYVRFLSWPRLLSLIELALCPLSEEDMFEADLSLLLNMVSPFLISLLLASCTNVNTFWTPLEFSLLLLLT